MWIAADYLSSWASLWGSRLCIWYPRKLQLLTIPRLWRYCGPSNYRFNFLLCWYAPWVFFEVVNVLSCSPFMFENTENIQLIDGYWCAQCVLPRWFRHKDSGWIPTLKPVWKYCTRSSILFICNTICCWLILVSSLYIELALVCCMNPENNHIELFLGCSLSEAQMVLF